MYSGLVVMWKEKQGIMVNTAEKVDPCLEFGDFSNDVGVFSLESFHFHPVIAQIWSLGE